MLKSSQGRARPMQISNTLLPIDELTALSPKPCLATRKAWIRFGVKGRGHNGGGAAGDN